MTDPIFAFDGADGAAARLGRRAEARPAAHRVGMGRPVSDAELARGGRARALPHEAHAVHEGHHGRAVARPSGAAGRVHEGGSGRRDGSGQLLSRLHHPPGARAGAGGAADRGARQAQLAPAHRSADRGERIAQGEGEAGPLARRRQHDAVEGVRRRHPDHDRRELGGGPALDPGALHLPRRGRRLSGLGRRGRRSGVARRGAVADLRPPAQGVPGLDADDPRAQPHRARVRGERPAAVLRGLPALRTSTVAEVRAAALGEGQAGDRGLRLRGLRRGASPSTTRRRCSSTASGGRRRCRPIPRPSASTSRRSIRRSAGSAGSGSPGRGRRPKGPDEAIRAFRNTILGETWVETGEAPDWRRLYDRRGSWPAGTVPQGRAVPDRRRRRAEGPHRGRRLGLGPRAGELARRSCRHRRRARACGDLGRSSRRC